MRSPIAVTDISHFHAPYKDAMFAGLGNLRADYVRVKDDSASSGYGVYEGVGHDTDGLGAVRRRRGRIVGRKRSVHGYGATDSPVPSSPLPSGAEVPVSTLAPFFDTSTGLTFATDQAATTLDQVLQTWAPVDPAFALPLGKAGNSTGIAFYHGTNTPPAGAEPASYQPLQTVLAQNLPKAGSHSVVLTDKRILIPQANKLQIIVTSDPKVVADNAGVGGDYFLTKDADPTTVMAAQNIAKNKGGAGGIFQAGFVKSPAGIAMLAVAGVGALYFATRSKKRR